jgi:trimeric autotransporter adhesin
MKKAIYLIMLILTISMVSASWNIDAGKNNNQIFYCLNATDGVRVGTAATINCTSSSAFTTTLATIAATNRATGAFNVTLNLASGAYTCEIDCGTATAVDYYVAVYSDTTTILTAISQNATNVINNLAQSQSGNTTLILNAVSGNATNVITTVGKGISQNATVMLAAESGNYTSTIVVLGTGMNQNFSMERAAIGQNSTDLKGAIANNGSTMIGYVDTEVAEILQMARGNTSNWFTSTYQTYLSRAIASLDQNASYWNVWGAATKAITGGTVDTATSCTSTGSVTGSVNSVTTGVTIGAGQTVATATTCGTTNGLSASAVQSIDTQLNSSHSSGNWSATGTGATAPTVEQIDAQLNSSHGKGEWNNTNSGASVDLSSIAKESSIATISNVVNRTEIAVGQNATNILTNTSIINTGINTIIANQNTEYLATQDVNNSATEVKGSVRGNSTNWFTSLFQTRIDAAISSRGTSTVTEASIDAQLNTSHLGNWSAVGSSSGSVSITDADAQLIANVTWYQNASRYCTSNTTFNRDMIGKYLCDIWKFR